MCQATQCIYPSRHAHFLLSGDFAREIWTSTKFFFKYAQGKPETRAQKDIDEAGQIDFDKAFLQDKHGRRFTSRSEEEGGLFARGKPSMDRGASPVYTDDGTIVGSPVVKHAENPNFNSYPMRDMDGRR